MNRRALTIVLAVLLPAAATVVAARGSADPDRSPQFASLGTPSMPFVPYQGFINATWFCAGVPTGGTGLGGSVTVANPSDAPLDGQVTVFTDAPDTPGAEVDFQVPARDTYTLDLATAQASGSYLSAMVEIVGGGGFVEQQADHPDGSAVSACSNSTSSAWYFADNYTLNGSQEDLVVTNPFPDDAIIDIGFASDDGERAPQDLQGVPVPGHSVLVVNERFLARDEAVLAVSIVASRGRVVAGRSQQYLGERQGYTMSLGSPAGSNEWRFADGGLGGDTSFERYSIYNPGDRVAVVRPVFLGVFSTDFNDVESIEVPAHRVVSFNVADVPDLPDGPHGLLFASENDTPVVVERAITRRAGDGFVTTVVRGVETAFGQADTGYYRWSTAIGTDLAVDGVLVVLNLTGSDATVAVKALGPGGEIDVPGLEAVALPAQSVVSIAIPDIAAALGHPLIIVGTQPIIVERLLPRGGDLRGRSGSLALPG